MVDQELWALVLIFIYLVLQFVVLKIGNPPSYLTTPLSWQNVFKLFSGEEYLNGSFYFFFPLSLAGIIYGLLRTII